MLNWCAFVVTFGTSQNATCDLDCSGHGNCAFAGSKNDTKSCLCDERFVDDDCHYEQKSKKHAFLLSFFLGAWGADRFYLECYEVGLIKFLFTLHICIIPCLPALCACCMRDDNSSILCSVALLCTICFVLIIICWWIADWALILADELFDCNNVPLYKDM